MKNFDDYKPEQTPVTQQGDVFSAFSEFASRYEGKSGEELIAAIIKEAERSKKNGTLKDEDIDKFAETISPMLNGRQKRLLLSVIEKIKG